MFNLHHYFEVIIYSMYIFFRIPLIAFKFVLSIFTKLFYHLNSCFAVVAQLKKKVKEFTFHWMLFCCSSSSTFSVTYIALFFLTVSLLYSSLNQNCSFHCFGLAFYPFMRWHICIDKMAKTSILLYQEGDIFHKLFINYLLKPLASFCSFSGNLLI